MFLLFLATMYVFNYAEEHGFEPYTPDVVHFQTDTIHVKEALKFDQISDVTGVDKDLIRFLNPSYKLDVVPVIKDKKYTLRLPVEDIGTFVANEDDIYDYIRESMEEENLPKYQEVPQRIRYRVKSGDFLGRIASLYGVSVTQIKNWNGLRTNNIRAGQYLVIYPRKTVAQTTQTTSPQKPAADNPKVYTVQRGDSIWSIAQKFSGITVSQIREWNDISGSHLKPGMKLKLSQG